MGTILGPTQGDVPRTADAVIIGGGIVGTATAFFLSQEGLDTVLVEMREGLSTLTTPKSVECYRKQFTEPALAELASESIEFYEHFPDRIGDPEADIQLTPQGYLFYTDQTSSIPLLQKAVQQHRDLGINDSEFLEGAQLRSRFPYLGSGVKAGTFRQGDGWFSSHAATQGFARFSQAVFLLSTKALDIKRDQRGVSAVVTERGTIAARTVVNAAGPFAGEIGAMVDLDLPLTPVRRQKAYLSPHPLIPQTAPMTIDLEREVYFRPETGGALIGWVDPDEPPSPPSENPPTDRYFAAKTIHKLSQTIPFWNQLAGELGSDDVRISAGQYVYTPDDQPLIGEVTEVPGFYLNCGYWAGVMLAAGAGQRTARLITGKQSPESNPLRPSRFSEGINLEGSSFLRGRNQNQGS